MNHRYYICRRGWRLLGGLLCLVALAGCLPTPKATAVPLSVATLAPLATATPSATPVEPAPTVTATPTDAAPESMPTTAPTATPKAMPTATPAPTPTLAPSGASPEVFAVVGVAGDDVLNVRAGPGIANSIVGTIPPYGMGVSVTGDGQPVGQSVWAPIVYGDVAGWVNTQYLARQVGQADAAVAARASEIVQALRDRDWATVARSVYPATGVRFSPYVYVRAGPGALEDRDRVVQAGEIEALAAHPTVYRWGRYDGTGDPIDLTFVEYVDRFVYDAEYSQPHVVGYGETIGQGNTINNVAEVYPDAVTVEYHFTGFDPQVMGMDWRSLRLVLEEKDGNWYLVGIVHDEWTI
jgi:hypothetical protein